ncbi:MAG: type IV secretion system DNA-binding domain-containing protein, partial [Opitutaceae bacterium]
IPLRNDDYPVEAHTEDILRRQSRRSGMLLTADELFGFIRFPTSAVRSPKFLRQWRRTKAAPESVRASQGLALGTNRHAGETVTVRLSAEQRVRHMHLVGASGTGKSTLLFNLIRQDIENGQGVGVLDPHGDLIDQLLTIIPESRIRDVVLIDPSDETVSIGFNILSAHSDAEKNLLASDLVSVFRRLSTSWGDQMDRVLANAILAFLESERGGTLLDLRRFLIEPAFREKFLSTVRDSEIIYYWRKGFAQLSGNKSVGPVLTRLETFLAPKPIRYMVAQQGNRLDFGDIIDSGKIFLAKLSQGALGKENAHLLGSLFVAKFQQLAMSRQRQAAAARKDFWLYLDEFQDFMTPSMAEMLAGTRKYRLGLALAHQEMRQMERDPDVAGAVSNAYTRICFRVGDQDARSLANGLTSFEARDLQNLGTGEAVCRVERSDFDFNLAVELPPRPTDAEAARRRAQVINASRECYATPRAEIEAALRREMEAADVAEVRPEPRAKERSAKPEKKSEDLGPASPPPVPASVVPAVVNHVPPLLPPPVSQPTRVVNQPEGGDVPADVKPSTSPEDWGRGGRQHSAVAKRIKEAAEEIGFRVAAEDKIPNGTGSIDLVLARGDVAIACEITVTNTIDYEVGNVEKCVKAGFGQIAVVGVTPEKLKRMETAVAHALGAAVAARVNYFLPDDFIAHVRAMPLPLPAEPPAPEVRQSRGYRVKRSYPTLTAEETKARESQTIDALADLMRRKKKR